MLRLERVRFVFSLLKSLICKFTLSEDVMAWLPESSKVRRAVFSERQSTKVLIVERPKLFLPRSRTSKLEHDLQEAAKGDSTGV